MESRRQEETGRNTIVLYPGFILSGGIIAGYLYYLLSFLGL